MMITCLLNYCGGGGWDKGSVEKVEELYFHKLGLEPERINIIKGLFEDTIHKSKNKINQIALLHLDGDWYESTKTCINDLYDSVTVGGYVVVDDYGHWRGCKQAITEFFNERKIHPTIHKVDYTRIYFRKLV